MKMLIARAFGFLIIWLALTIGIGMLLLHLLAIEVH